MRSLSRHKPPEQPPAPVQRPTGVPAAKLPCAPGTGRTVLDELVAADRPQIRVCPWPRRHRTEPTAAERLAGIGLLYATRHPGVQTGAEL